MDNFNYQAYIKSGKIHGKSESLTEAQATGFGIGQGRSKTISKGKESNSDLKDTLKDEEPKKSKYFMKNGIPHKADGTPLKRMNNEEEELEEDARTDAEQEGYKDGFEDAKDDIEDALKKMKVSELKAKIKEQILAELTLSEADEEVDVDIDVKDEVEVEAGADDIEIERKGTVAKVEVGLSPEEEIVQDSLKAAMDAAQALGSEKLADQIGNTITFFTRQFVVGNNAD